MEANTMHNMEVSPGWRVVLPLVVWAAALMVGTTLLLPKEVRDPVEWWLAIFATPSLLYVGLDLFASRRSRNPSFYQVTVWCVVLTITTSYLLRALLVHHFD
jgi:hypothetical protein